MSYYKICVCGEKTVFENPMGYPERCSSCHRSLEEPPTYREEEKVLMNETPAPQQPISRLAPAASGVNATYAFQLPSGAVIPIPEGGGIIGRTELGAELLADYPSVSRQHIRVFLHETLGILVKDISSYGTIVDGIRIDKNTPTHVAENATITLCNLELKIISTKG